MRAGRPARSASRRSMLADRFLVLNGDVLCDLDLSALLRVHESAGARATIALHPVADPSAYGLVRRSESGEITEFLEKPEPDQIDTDEINAGAYVLERSVLELIPPDREVSIEREVFPRLVGGELYGAPARGLLDRHRDPRALPAGELGHPRGADRGHTRRADRRGGPRSPTAPRSRSAL